MNILTSPRFYFIDLSFEYVNFVNLLPLFAPVVPVCPVGGTIVVPSPPTVFRKKNYIGYSQQKKQKQNWTR